MNFILVMEALITDSPTVPSLLTEYILKGEKQLKLVFSLISVCLWEARWPHG